MSDGEEDKEEDMRDEEEVSDSEEGDEKQRRSREVERRLIPAGPPGINRVTSVQKSSSEKTGDSSDGAHGKLIRDRFIGRKIKIKCVTEARVAQIRKPLTSTGNETLEQQTEDGVKPSQRPRSTIRQALCAL